MQTDTINYKALERLQTWLGGTKIENVQVQNRHLVATVRSGDVKNPRTMTFRILNNA